MAAGFLRRWLGRVPANSPEVAEALANLERIVHDRPSLASLARLLADLLPELFNGEDESRPTNIEQTVMDRKLANGIPLLRGEPLELDGPRLQKRWTRVSTVVCRHRPSDDAKRLQRSRLDPAALVQAVIAGDVVAVATESERVLVPPDLVASVLRLTAFPTLAQLRNALQPQVPSAGWGRGYCPICGNRPLLGEFRGLDQPRFLRCGWCAGEWSYPRLQCPSCGTQDHRSLRFLSVESEGERIRVAVCEACRGYVKQVATLTPLPPPALLVCDLATLHLDLVASDRGYSNAT